MPQSQRDKGITVGPLALCLREIQIARNVCQLLSFKRAAGEAKVAKKSFSFI